MKKNKKTKRFGALLLALAMVLSLSVTAFADSTKDFGGTGTGSGTIVIHKYDHTGITLTSDYANGTAQAGTTVVGTDSDGANVTLGDLIKLPGIEFKLEEVELTGTDPENMAHYTVKAGGVTSTLETDANGELSWVNLPSGTYKITELANDTTDTVNNVAPFLVKLPFTDPANTSQYLSTVHVYPKNTVTPPDIEKDSTPTAVDGSGNVINSGSILGWKLTADIPNDIATALSYVITDTPSQYLRYVADSLAVYYLDDSSTKVALTATTDYTLDTSGGKIEVTLTAAGKTRLGNAISTGTIETAQKLYVTYSTKITITATELETLIAAQGDSVLTNTAQVDFTNKNGYVYKPGKAEEETDVFGLKITKVDKNGSAITTADAKFKVYTTLSGTSVDQNSLIGEYTSDASGLITIPGLAAGTYYIVETQAPTGYNLLTGYITVTVAADGTATVSTGSTAVYDDTTGLISFNITNLKGFTLPQTGGTGTMIFTIIGMMLIIAAGVCIVVSRKKRAQN